MPIQGLDISLNIRNNTNYPQQINVMGNPANLLDTANATTEYRWDLTGFSVTFENTVSVQYKRNTDPTFLTFTWDLEGNTLQSVVIALNNLGIGFFNLYDELGNTYIGTYNQNYAFGDLNIFNPSISTTTTTTTTTIAPTTTTTTTTSTTAAPTTSTTSTTTTAAPTTTTSTTTTTTTNALYSQFTLGYSALNGNDSCAEYVLTPTSFYAISGTLILVNGTILYTDNTLTTLVPNGFYSNGTDNWAVVGGNGTLSAQSSCGLTTTTSTTSTTTTAAPTTTSTTTTTTTVAFSTFSLQPSSIDQPDACSTWPSGLVNYYTAFGATLQNGTTIYTDTALTTPAPDGYYANGTLSWATSGGTGVLASENACTIISFSIGYNIFNGGSSYTGYNTNTNACLAGGTLPVIGVFSTSPIADGVVLFLDAALTIPFVSTGGYYWASGGIGIYYYFTYSGQVVGFNSCPTTTTTTTTTTAAPTTTTSTTTTTTTAATTTTTSTTTTTTTAAVTQNIFITNGSLDVAISQVDFNGVTATYAAGQPLPNTTGNGTNLYTTQIGTYTLDVYRNNATAGQHITVTDSVGAIQCIYFGSGSAVESYTNVLYDGVNPIQIDVQDGVCPTTIPLTWEWTNNNVVETPPYGGGYITIAVNSIVVVNQTDTSSTTTTIYNGGLTPNIGDSIDVTIYSYPNNTYGTQTNLSIESPLGNYLINANDTQPAAGSPSTLTYSFTVTSNVINIVGSSNSY